MLQQGCAAAAAAAAACCLLPGTPGKCCLVNVAWQCCSAKVWLPVKVFPLRSSSLVH